MRIDTVGDIRMPPIDRETIDEHGVALMREWIDSMPGRPVLAPPVIEPAGGTFDKPVEIRLTDSQVDADIRYTLDGSVPGPTDARYDKPIMLQRSRGGAGEGVQGRIHAQHHGAGSVRRRAWPPLIGYAATIAIDQGLLPALTRRIS